MKDGRTQITQAYCAPMGDAYLYCIQKGIHFPSNDYNGTPAVLFIWLKAQMICIDSLFIHCWTQHCIGECRQNGSNYASLWLHSGARWWRSQTGRKGAIKGHLLSFVNSKKKKKNGKHFLLWLIMVHLGLQITLVNHMHVLGLSPFLTNSAPLSLTWPPPALWLKWLSVSHW